MKSQQQKLHNLIMHFLTPETYPNYQLSHHPFSFPLTVEKKENPRLYYNNIFAMFAAALAAVFKLIFHRQHNSEKNSPVFLYPNTEFRLQGSH